MAVINKQTGNLFWQVLLCQKASTIMLVKEQMNEYENGNLFRNFRQSLCFQDAKVMKYGVRILEIYYKFVLPAEYKALGFMSTYQQLERYYEDLQANKTIPHAFTLNTL